jgi:hypothetical protein
MTNRNLWFFFSNCRRGAGETHVMSSIDQNTTRNSHDLPKNRIARYTYTDVITSVQYIYLYILYNNNTRSSRCRRAGKNVRRIYSIIINYVLFHRSFIQVPERRSIIIILWVDPRLYSLGSRSRTCVVHDDYPRTCVGGGG